MATTNYSWNLPTVGGSEDTWGTQLNQNWTALDTLLGGVSATEFAILDGATITTADLNALGNVTWTLSDYNTLTASAAELNVLDGVTATTAEINKLDGVTWNLTDYNSLTASAAELNILDGFTGIATLAEAEAGSSSTTLMTPQRTREAIVHLLPTSTTVGPFSNSFPQYSYGGTTVLGTITDLVNPYLLFTSATASQTNPGTTTVYVQRSSNNGSTWGSAITVATITDTTSADGTVSSNGDITISMVGYNAVRIVHTSTQEIFSASVASNAVMTVRAE